MSADEAETRARAIVEEARSQRRGASRTTWLVALAIGAACVLGFVLVIITMLANPSTSSDLPHAQSSSHGFGFAIGLTAGLVMGIAIGFAIARQRQRDAQVSSASSASHSERNRP